MCKTNISQVRTEKTLRKKSGDLDCAYLMDELKGTLSDGNIRIFQAIDDGRSMTLHGRRINLHNLPQRVQGHVSDVIISVQKESKMRPQHQGGKKGDGPRLVGHVHGMSAEMDGESMIFPTRSKYSSTQSPTATCPLPVAQTRMKGKAYRPRMLIASTLSPFSVSRVMMVCTHSYRIALPAFFAVSVLLATCQHSKGWE